MKLFTYRKMILTASLLAVSSAAVAACYNSLSQCTAAHPCSGGNTQCCAKLANVSGQSAVNFNISHSSTDPNNDAGVMCTHKNGGLGNQDFTIVTLDPNIQYYLSSTVHYDAANAKFPSVAYLPSKKVSLCTVGARGGINCN